MTRLPPYYRESYLEPEHDGARLSGLPADLGHFLDQAAGPDQPLELQTTILHFMSPKPLADRVGNVSVSALPAVLDELLRRTGDEQSSFFLDPFAVMVVGGLPPAAPVRSDEARALLEQAVADHFEAVDELFHHGASPAECEQAARDVLGDCDPDLQRFDVTLRFEVSDQPRGDRLLSYLFDVRPGVLTPAAWPARVVL